LKRVVGVFSGGPDAFDRARRHIHHTDGWLDGHTDQPASSGLRDIYGIIPSRDRFVRLHHNTRHAFEDASTQILGTPNNFRGDLRMFLDAIG